MIDVIFITFISRKQDNTKKIQKKKEKENSKITKLSFKSESPLSDGNSMSLNTSNEYKTKVIFLTWYRPFLMYTENGD